MLKAISKFSLAMGMAMNDSNIVSALVTLSTSFSPRVRYWIIIEFLNFANSAWHALAGAGEHDSDCPVGCNRLQLSMSMQLLLLERSPLYCIPRQTSKKNRL